MPPAPSGTRISYGPRRVEGVRGIELHALYRAKKGAGLTAQRAPGRTLYPNPVIIEQRPDSLPGSGPIHSSGSANDRIFGPPAIATNCRPSARYVMGDAFQLA